LRTQHPIATRAQPSSHSSIADCVEAKVADEGRVPRQITWACDPGGQSYLTRNGTIETKDVDIPGTQDLSADIVTGWASYPARGAQEGTAYPAGGVVEVVAPSHNPSVGRASVVEGSEDNVGGD